MKWYEVVLDNSLAGITGLSRQLIPASHVAGIESVASLTGKSVTLKTDNSTIAFVLTGRRGIDNSVAFNSADVYFSYEAKYNGDPTWIDGLCIAAQLRNYGEEPLLQKGINLSSPSTTPSTMPSGISSAAPSSAGATPSKLPSLLLLAVAGIAVWYFFIKKKK